MWILGLTGIYRKCKNFLSPGTKQTVGNNEVSVCVLVGICKAGFDYKNIICRLWSFLSNITYVQDRSC